MTFRILWALAALYIRDTQGRSPRRGERLQLINTIRRSITNKTQQKGS